MLWYRQRDGVRTSISERRVRARAGVTRATVGACSTVTGPYDIALSGRPLLFRTSQCKSMHARVILDGGAVSTTDADDLACCTITLSVSCCSHTPLHKNQKLIRRWDSERELSLRRRRIRTTKYNRLVHKFRHRSTQLCVGTHVYQMQWNNAM